MLTVKELKEFIKDFDDDIEVRIESIYDSESEESYHSETSDISYQENVGYDRFLILKPKDIELN